MALRVRDLELGGPVGRAPAVIVPLTGTGAGQLRAQALEIGALAGAGEGPDLVEWRVDLLAEREPDAVARLGRELVLLLGGLPLLATVRTSAEGGPGEPDEVEPLLGALVDARVADLVDVELSLDDALGRPVVSEVLERAHAAGVGVVASWHDWAGTPPAARLHAWLDRAEAAGADVRKVAVTPAGPDDVLTLLQVTLDAARAAEATGAAPVVAIAMGPLGAVSRLAGGVFGSAATFATVGAASAPGQLPLADVRAALAMLHGGTA